jgi:hypothetical protein
MIRAVTDPDPWETVKAQFAPGLAELEPLLEQHGFVLAPTEFGRGSGGPFSEATFPRGERSMTVWLRDASLSVVCRCGAAEVDHLGYMREVAGVGGPNEFPTYGEDAVASFAAVRRDLHRFGTDFLIGDCGLIRQAAARVAARGSSSPMRRLAELEAEVQDEAGSVASSSAAAYLCRASASSREIVVLMVGPSGTEARAVGRGRGCGARGRPGLSRSAIRPCSRSVT